MIIMQIACDAVTKICYSLSVCVPALRFSIPDKMSETVRGREPSVSLQRKAGARTHSHTHSTQDTTDAKKKNWSKATNVIWDEIPHQSYFIFVAGDGRESERNVEMGWRGSSRTRDFTVNFVISLLTNGVAKHASWSWSRSTMTTVTSLYFACGIHSTRFTDIRYSTYAVFFSHCKCSLQWNKYVSAECGMKERRKFVLRKDAWHRQATKRSDSISRNIRNNSILLKFVIGHDKHRPSMWLRQNMMCKSH